jgi:hypothetical protein
VPNVKNTSNQEEWTDIPTPEAQDSGEEWTDIERNSPLSSAIKGGLQGITFGFSDEIKGAVKAGAKAVGNVFAPKDDFKGLLETYRQERGAARLEDEMAARDNPVSYGAGNLAGSVLVPIPGLGVGVGAVKAGVSAAKGLTTAGKLTKEAARVAAQDTAKQTVSRLAQVSAPKSAVEAVVGGAKEVGKVTGQGALAGGAQSLGMSKADITEGDLAGLTSDVKEGALLGGLLGGSLAGIGQTVKGTVAARKMIDKPGTANKIQTLSKEANDIKKDYLSTVQKRSDADVNFNTAKEMEQEAFNSIKATKKDQYLKSDKALDDDIAGLEAYRDRAKAVVEKNPDDPGSLVFLKDAERQLKELTDYKAARSNVDRYSKESFEANAKIQNLLSDAKPILNELDYLKSTGGLSRGIDDVRQEAQLRRSTAVPQAKIEQLKAKVKDLTEKLKSNQLSGPEKLALSDELKATRGVLENNLNKLDKAERKLIENLRESEITPTGIIKKAVGGAGKVAARSLGYATDTLGGGVTGGVLGEALASASEKAANVVSKKADEFIAKKALQEATSGKQSKLLNGMKVFSDAIADGKLPRAVEQYAPMLAKASSQSLRTLILTDTYLRKKDPEYAKAMEALIPAEETAKEAELKEIQLPKPTSLATDFGQLIDYFTFTDSIGLDDMEMSDQVEVAKGMVPRLGGIKNIDKKVVDTNLKVPKITRPLTKAEQEAADRAVRQKEVLLGKPAMTDMKVKFDPRRSMDPRREIYNELKLRDQLGRSMTSNQRTLLKQLRRVFGEE